MNRILPIIIAFLCVGCSINVFGQTIYVSQNGDGDGSSWENALGDIHSALDQAVHGDQIWIMSGEYFPTNCSTCSQEDREIAFTIPTGVSIYGGFNGTEVTESNRDIHANPTILNGNIGNPYDRKDNSYSIFKLEYPDQSNIIDGFILKDGNADGEGDSLGPKLSGAAIHVKSNGATGISQFSVFNCSFINNRAHSNGGAIMIYAGFGGECQFDISNCIFLGNAADLKGGAIHFYAAFDGTISGTINNCEFEQCRAIEGGALNMVSAKEGHTSIDFEDCSFNFNEASSKGGALSTFTSTGIGITNFENCYFSNNSSNLGGAIFLDGSIDGKSNGSYSKCTFEANQGKGGGGAIYNNGTSGECNNSYFQCVFKSNYCIQSGSAFFNSGSNGGVCLPTFDKSRFIENSTTMYGAGMYNFGKTGECSPIVTNCLFVGNESDSGTSIYSYGGQNGLSEPQIINTTFTKNIARVGPCIYNQASDTTGTVRPFVSNCIFWDNIATSGFGLVFQNGHAEPTIQYSLIPFEDCELLNTQPNSDLTCGPGIIFNSDPNFVDPGNNDFRLTSNSPAVDMGFNYDDFVDSFDLDGANRILNAIDLGPFEMDPNSPILITNQPSSGVYCEGNDAGLVVEIIGGTALSYQWYHNGDAVDDSDFPILNLTSILKWQEGEYYCVIQTNAGELQSETAFIEVKKETLASLTLVADQQQFCEGDTLKTVEAIIENPGYYDQLTWYLNGQQLSEEINILSVTVDDMDEISAQLISSSICLGGTEEARDTLLFEEQAFLTASVDLSTEQNSYCEGQDIQVLANTVNGGDHVSFKWYLNNTLLPDTSSNITLSNIESNDALFVEMTSSLDCVVDNIIESEELIFSINPTVVPSIIIEDTDLDSLCLGSSKTFNLIYENEGSNPVYNWYLNQELQEGHEGSISLLFDEVGTFTLIGEMVSSEECAIPNMVNSELLEFEILSCMTSSTVDFKKEEMSIFPNPNNGIFTIQNLDNFNLDNQYIEIYNNFGVKVHSLFLNKKNKLNSELNLSFLPNGSYFLHVSNQGSNKIMALQIFN